MAEFKWFPVKADGTLDFERLSIAFHGGPCEVIFIYIFHILMFHPELKNSQN